MPFVHTKVGVGIPNIIQVKMAVSVWLTVSSEGSTVTSGGPKVETYYRRVDRERKKGREKDEKKTWTETERQTETERRGERGGGRGGGFVLIQNISVMTTKFLNKQHMQIQGKMTKINVYLRSTLTLTGSEVTVNVFPGAPVFSPIHEYSASSLCKLLNRNINIHTSSIAGKQ